MVKQVYKQTDVGVIPEDWSCAKFGEMVKIYRGGSPRPIQDYITHLSTGINWIKIGDVGENDKYIRSTQEKIIPEGVSKSREVHVGDFILSNSMSFGRPYILDIDGCIHDGWLTIQEYKNTFSTEYLYYLLSSDLVYQQYISMAAGSSVKNLNKDKVSALNVIYPTMLEQKCIAEALSDMDSMISSLEKLIAKKKAIKQGAMQELLTGKRRIKGFSEDWKEHTLGDLCCLVTKQTGFDYTNEIKPSLVDINSTGTLPFIQNKDFCGKKINMQTDYYIPYDVAIKYPRILLDETCLLISLSGRIGNVGLYEKSNGLSFIGGAVGICRFNSEQNAEWCMLYLQSSSGQKQIFECQKSGAQHNLTVEDVRKLVVKLPRTLEEQAAIASILSDMDNEIEALEQKLEKTRQIKQGMMQQLLTGKIRLVLESADNKPIEAVSKPHHNHQFDDAVMIAAIVNEFYNDTIPLGRKKVQKLLYLLRRKQEADTSAFKKKAAGPYADEVRYKGGEPIAIRSKYVAKKQGAKGTTFSKGEKIESALKYIEKWEMTDDINWLVSTFKYTKTTDLELFATIDMAICDLEHEGIEVSVDAVKNLIASNKEWKEKLSKSYFSDKDIARAIMICKKVL